MLEQREASHAVDVRALEDLLIPAPGGGAVRLGEVARRAGWSWSPEDQRQIYAVLAAALVLVFMITAALFESLRQPMIVLLTVPMALVGIFAAFLLTVTPALYLLFERRAAARA